MEEPEVLQNFFGVYLLYCTNPKHRGKTYIGYTVNPKRRLKQHNAGKKCGGAWKTSNKGPWKMVLIVHGFPNSTSALRFEWAWQHPDRSRRLKHVPKKKSSKQLVIDYRLCVLSEMLQVGPWNRLPLTLRWLEYEFYDNKSASIGPPMHMPISYGQIVSQSLKKKNYNKKVSNTVEPEYDAITLCSLCDYFVQQEDKVTCIKSECPLMAHLICLAKNFRKDKMLLPIAGDCPTCGTNVLWGDLIRKKIGCDLHLKNADDAADESEDNFD